MDLSVTISLSRITSQTSVLGLRGMLVINPISSGLLSQLRRFNALVTALYVGHVQFTSTGDFLGLLSFFPRLLDLEVPNVALIGKPWLSPTISHLRKHSIPCKPLIDWGGSSDIIDTLSHSDIRLLSNLDELRYSVENFDGMKTLDRILTSCQTSLTVLEVSLERLDDQSVLSGAIQIHTLTSLVNIKITYLRSSGINPISIFLAESQALPIEIIELEIHPEEQPDSLRKCDWRCLGYAVTDQSGYRSLVELQFTCMLNGCSRDYDDWLRLRDEIG